MTTVAANTVEIETTQLQSPVLRPHSRTWLPWALLGLWIVLFVYGERSIPYAGPSEWGLIGASSPAYALSILLVIVTFTIAVRQRNFRASVAATMAMVVVLQLPRAIATDMPMYSWTYKHLGVVDYVQHTRALAKGVDVYNGWPGLFGLTAWFSDVTGVSPMDIAHWWIPCFHLIFVSLIYVVARAWGLDPLKAVTAAYVAASLNWVQQDYFSPQAVALLLAAGILALIPSLRNGDRAGWLVIVLFAAITISHPLTPYWLLVIIGGLVVTRRIRPWWILIPLIAIALAQVIYNSDQVSHYSFFSGDFLANTQTNLSRWHFQPVLGQKLVSIGNKVQAISFWSATAISLLYMWRKKQPMWALAVVTFGGMFILGGVDYGGESIFRVYLYCLMGCSVVLAPMIVALLQASMKVYLGALGVLIVWTSFAVMGNTGSWYANVMPKSQVETSRIVLSQAELPAYLTIVAPTWPERSTWRYVDYARFNSGFDAPMILTSSLVGRHFDTDADYATFIEALESRTTASTYLVMTDQMQVYCWYFGILPWDALPNLKARLYQDKQHWEPFYDGGGISVFVHRVNTTASKSSEADEPAGSGGGPSSPTDSAPAGGSTEPESNPPDSPAPGAGPVAPEPPATPQAAAPTAAIGPPSASDGIGAGATFSTGSQR